VGTDKFLGALTSKAHALRGSYSLHAHTRSVLDDDELSRATSLQRRASMVLDRVKLYARAFVYLNSPVPMTRNQILNFSDVSGNGAAAATTTIATWSSTTTPTLDGQIIHGSASDGSMVCLQFDIPVGMAGTAHLFVGGA